MKTVKYVSIFSKNIYENTMFPCLGNRPESRPRRSSSCIKDGEVHVDCFLSVLNRAGPHLGHYTCPVMDQLWQPCKAQVVPTAETLFRAVAGTSLHFSDELRSTLVGEGR